MKLSEEIRLGAMVGPQAFGMTFIDNHGSCAFGAALIARGLVIDDGNMFAKNDHRIASVVDVWSWLDGLELDCPECGSKQRFGCVVHLNDKHHWTRERIADYVETFEPQETPEEKREVVEIFCESLVNQ
jgi:hypothetical protein